MAKARQTQVPVDITNAGNVQALPCTHLGEAVNKLSRSWQCRLGLLLLARDYRFGSRLRGRFLYSCRYFKTLPNEERHSGKALMGRAKTDVVETASVRQE